MPDQNKYLMREDELPEDLEFVERAAITTGSASAPSQQGVDRYQGAILSAPLGLDTDIARTQLPGANPVYRLMPASIAGNPASNASIQSTAAKTIAVTPGPSTGASDITLNIPNIFTPITQDVTLPGPLAFNLASEPPGYVFQGPVPGLSGYEGSTLGTFRSVGGGGTMAVSQIPTTATSFGLYFSNAGVLLPAPSGWTSFGAATQFFWKAITGTSPVSVSLAIPTNVDATAALSLFEGPVPTFIQQNTTSGQSGTLTFSGSNTSGNTLIVAIRASMSGPAIPFSIVMSDTNGNVYQQLVNQAFLGGNGLEFQSSIFVCANCAGGVNSVNWNVTGPGSFNTPVISISEFGPLGLGNGTPFFGPLGPTLIPPINLSSSGNGGVGGILPVANGGTGVQLSTGTTKTVLSASPTFTGTVALPIATLSGKITNYNGIATVSDGVPAEYATVDLTAQAANVGPSTLYVVPASGVGLYRISSYIVMTTAASVSSTLPTVQIVYTDNDSNVSVTMDATPVSASAGLGQTGALNVNAAGSAASGVIAVYVKASTTIQYQTINYASTAAGMQYALRIKLEAL